MNEKTAARLAAKKRTLKPRNPLATAALLRKGGEHARTDKKAGRARQKAAWLKSRDE
ncbi:MAG: hypothetical protein RBS46_06750 [Methyloversatilis sp.]|jgi:hypothetical protein|nr:hypothetical protein [Methyloversatilis sp.]